jgi:hypothetical protein
MANINTGLPLFSPSRFQLLSNFVERFEMNRSAFVLPVWELFMGSSELQKRVHLSSSKF